MPDVSSLSFILLQDKTCIIAFYTFTRFKPTILLPEISDQGMIPFQEDSCKYKKVSELLIIFIDQPGFEKGIDKFVFFSIPVDDL